MQFETAIRTLVEEIVAEKIGAVSSVPELITMKDAAEICGCDLSVINALVHDRAENGFPAIVLGRRTIRIDKARLQRWFMNGGLNGSHQEDRRSEVSDTRFQRNR
jgi:hypothetical protein